MSLKFWLSVKQEGQGWGQGQRWGQGQTRQGRTDQHSTQKCAACLKEKRNIFGLSSHGNKSLQSSTAHRTKGIFCMIVISNTLYYHWVLLFAFLQQSRRSFFLSPATHCPFALSVLTPKTPMDLFVELKPQIEFLPFIKWEKIGKGFEGLTQLKCSPRPQSKKPLR